VIEPAETPAPQATSAAPPGNGRVETVRLEHVSKRFGRKVAVHDLSLTLYSGEVFAFLGPNGAGKTTTLKMSTGLLRSETGSVRLCGYDLVREARRAKEHIAYVPDQPFLYDKLTGREFIRFTREMYGVPADLADERLDRLAGRLDMHGFLDQLAENYSHGMKQKIVIAAALVHAPRVLVVDEPMIGLDPRTIRVMKTMFRELADAGGTVFMSIHVLDVAEAVADRIGIIHEGRLIALGTLQELRQSATRHERLEDIFLRLTQSPSEALAGASGAPDTADRQDAAP
jgi:ABC-2 type transport system ATP-binding protein